MNKKIYLILLLITICYYSSYSQKYIPPMSEKYIISRDTTPDGIIEGVYIPGCPPPKTYNKTAAKLTASSVILDNLPALSWCFGCTATSAAMTAGYYDRHGYVNMYTGPTNNGLFPMDNSSWGSTVINAETRDICPLSATMMGVDGRTTRGHVNDYWIKYGNTESDPYITNGWTEHTYEDCTADYMLTNQSKYNNSDGSTTIYYYTNGAPLDFSSNYPSYADGGAGFKFFMQSRGYSVSSYFNQYLYGYNGNTLGFTLDDYRAEINAGRPVLIQLVGHTMVGVGYEGSTSTIYIHNTWDYSTYTMTWGSTYSGMQHCGVSVFRLSSAGKVPLDFTLKNTTFSAGVDSCMNALDTITVAGNGNAVSLQSGSAINFIAGNAILFMPGFHAYSGCSMNASITTTSNFCTELPASVEIQPREKSIIASNSKPGINGNNATNKKMKVYPNPSNGLVTVELTNIEGSSDLTVTSTSGATVYHASLVGSNSSSIDLSQQPKGIYFIKVKNDKTIITTKVILQ